MSMNQDDQKTDGECLQAIEGLLVDIRFALWILIGVAATSVGINFDVG